MPGNEDKPTIIEVIADLIDNAHHPETDRPRTGTVLVAEQCMEVFYGGKNYHLEIIEIDDDGRPVREDQR